MNQIADLHIHSKYSRACSRDLDLPHIDDWCRRKGITIVGTGDFTHPRWFSEIKNQLVADRPGLYKLKGSASGVRFMMTTEISCIYTQGGKCRRLHLCVFASSMEAAEKITAVLNKRGFNLKSDGRPIIGLSAKNLLDLVLNADEKSLVIPAHAWTPWFSIFGSKSGFDSIEECFEDLSPHIYAIETGLSSDPPMNWRWSALDKITLISNSDCHSPANLGREANLLKIDEKQLSYAEISRIIREQDRKKFLATLEFFPEEGKYHIDGHANCHYSATPDKAKKNKNLCPVCGKPLTLGVLHRVDDLADREKIEPEKHVPYKHLIPLQELIADSFGVKKTSKKVMENYLNLTNKQPEFTILLDLAEKQLVDLAGADIANNIIKMRNGQVEINPGYDGVFGVINVKKNKKPIQANLL